MTIRILLVDDHPILRDGVKALIALQDDMDVVGEAQDGVAALFAYEKFLPDVTLMDLQMPRMGGLEALTTIRQKHANARIILLSAFGGDVQVKRALQNGASGYLLKSALHRELLDSIRAVHLGNRALTLELAQDVALGGMGEVLTERETEILACVARGYPNKRIGSRLGVTEDTVKGHLKNVFAKLNVTDRTSAVMTAIKRGIIET